MKVVTNDMMRDHRLALLPSVPFYRWQRTQVLRYKVQLTATDGDDESGVVEVVALPPSIQLLEIQQTPSFTCDMQNVDGDPNRWHIPISFQEAVEKEIRTINKRRGEEGGRMGREEQEVTESLELVNVENDVERNDGAAANTLCDRVNAGDIVKEQHKEKFGEIKGKFHQTSFLCLCVPDFLRMSQPKHHSVLSSP